MGARSTGMLVRDGPTADDLGEDDQSLPTAPACCARDGQSLARAGEEDQDCRSRWRRQVRRRWLVTAQCVHYTTRRSDNKARA
jgi:hypothetical protein